MLSEQLQIPKGNIEQWGDPSWNFIFPGSATPFWNGSRDLAPTGISFSLGRIWFFQIWYLNQPRHSAQQLTNALFKWEPSAIIQLKTQLENREAICMYLHNQDNPQKLKPIPSQHSQTQLGLLTWRVLALDFKNRSVLEHKLLGHVKPLTGPDATVMLSKFKTELNEPLKYIWSAAPKSTKKQRLSWYNTGLSSQPGIIHQWYACKSQYCGADPNSLDKMDHHSNYHHF